MTTDSTARAAYAEQAEVVVVGARCAGAATALLLARAGRDVLLLDRSRLRADTVSTHAFARGGVVQLSRWGLLDAVLATGAPAVRTVSFHLPDGGVERRAVKDRAGVDCLLAPRRQVLDGLVAAAAEAAGARLRTGATVTGVLRDGRGRACGVTVRDGDGPVRTVRCRLLVGADGVGSRVAGLVGAPVQEAHEPSGACLYAYVGDVTWEGYEFHLGRDQAFGGAFPTHGGEACVWLTRPTARVRDVLAAGSGRRDAWLATLRATVPALADAVGAGTVTSPVRGTVGLPNHRRRAAGPGWALVGDAGYHRDPITGHGMTDALRDAELLASAALRALADPQDEAAAWAAYQSGRDAAAADVFAITRALGAFPDPDTFLALQQRLATALDGEAQALAARPAPAGSVTTAA